MNAYEWAEGQYLTTFIIGNRYVTVLHSYQSFPKVIEETLEYVGEKNRTPFVILSSICCHVDTVIEHELAELVLGL